MGLPNIIQQINSKLPLSGGTLTGIIYSASSSPIRRNVDDSFLEFFGATTYKNGAFLRLDGKDGPNAGAFKLQTGDGTTNRVLHGKPDGTLTWNGYNVITSAGGTMTGGINLNNIGSISIANGDWVYPALLSNTSSGFYAISGYSPNQAGEFLCRANKDGTNFIDLRGCPDGTLTWNGTHIVRNTSASNGVNGYRKYSDGLIVQWGTYTNTSTSGTITFPVAFSNTNYSAVITQQGNATDTGGWGMGVAMNPTKSTTTITYSVQESCKITWIAIGY